MQQYRRPSSDGCQQSAVGYQWSAIDSKRQDSAASVQSHGLFGNVRVSENNASNLCAAKQLVFSGIWRWKWPSALIPYPVSGANNDPAFKGPWVSYLWMTNVRTYQVRWRSCRNCQELCDSSNSANVILRRFCATAPLSSEYFPVSGMEAFCYLEQPIGLYRSHEAVVANVSCNS